MGDVVNLLDLNQIAAECLADSRRWFPDLHATDNAAAMHFLVGLVGELGEAWEAEGDALGEELADCAIYALDLGVTLDVDLDGFLPIATADDGATLVHLGRIANAVKKWNRDPATAPPDITVGLRDLMALIIGWSSHHGFDLLAEIAKKQAICEQRWGAPS
jgi:NTP pyrophosphatase (non-canonical NTP hydrolase)